jgi:hypothetical protein
MKIELLFISESQSTEFKRINYLQTILSISISISISISLKETMSNIVCAYCHIKGHHIKFCAELVEKNRRRQEYATKNSRPVFPIQVNIVVKPHENIKAVQSKNVFSNLYSSDEEEEEDGEIFEDERSNAMKMKRLSALSSESESESEPEQPKWCRSGIKGVVIPIKTAINTVSADYSDDDEYVEMPPSLLNTLAEMRLYLSKFNGMSWADIECLSDCE